MVGKDQVGSNYLDERLLKLGITPEINTWLREKDGVTEWVYNFFSADQETGDINIQYFDLNGRPYYWKGENNKWPKPFVRTRLHPSNERLGQKYSQPKGSGQFPFFPPSIIRKYQAKEIIETLIVVEGEIKAFKAAMHGFDIIGIPSIHGFYNPGDIRGKLHEDIQELIVTCNVRNVIYLTDADTLSVSWEKGKDLAKRPQSFISAVKYFRESLQQLLDDDRTELKNVYYLHLHPKFIIDAKGIDDLLVAYSSVHDEIMSDLYQFQFARKYFVGFMLNDYNGSLSRLKKHFGLTDEKEFYGTYRLFIGEREFTFNRRRFRWDSEKKEVTFVKHEDAVKFMRIGADYLKIIKVPNKYGQLEEDIIPFKKTEIVQDYGKSFIEEIPKYDSFIVDPCWNLEYQRIVNGCYNLMEPLKWLPKVGTTDVTFKFLKHIFQGVGTFEKNVESDPFTVALDYLTILFRNPKQMLPVPILVSKENETGKSTFLKWMQAIYGSNTVILNNENFKQRFNAHYATKFIIGIDESFLDVDKKSEKERLKQMVTADQIYLELKGINLKKIQYYGKVILCSNDEDRIMKIDSEETRWFVVKVPMLSEKDPDMEIKLFEEIPAWLHLLSMREIFHPRRTRLWFSPQNIITEQFRVVVENTKNRLERIFEEWIRELFAYTGKAELRFSKKFIVQQLNNGRSKYTIDDMDLKSYLQRKGYTLSPPMYISSPRLKDYGISIDPNPDGPKPEINKRDLIEWCSETARAYTFKVEDWL